MPKKLDFPAKKYLLLTELNAIANEFALAMEKAYLPYVAQGRMTLHMEETMRRYYDWARRAVAEGLR